MWVVPSTCSGTPSCPTTHTIGGDITPCALLMPLCTPMSRQIHFSVVTLNHRLITGRRWSALGGRDEAASQAGNRYFGRRASREPDRQRLSDAKRGINASATYLRGWRVLLKCRLQGGRL
jgi:hypothetical protein